MACPENSQVLQSSGVMEYLTGNLIISECSGGVNALLAKKCHPGSDNRPLSPNYLTE